MDEKDCIGCPDGEPDEVRQECGPCGEVEFCSTLVFPAGFSTPQDPKETTTSDRAEYIEENFDIAAYFVEDCFKCWEKKCTINPDDFDNLSCGPITVTQTVIKGTIKYLSSVCLGSDSAITTGSQAAICDKGLICVEEPTAVCVGCKDGCENLRVVGAKDVTANREAVVCGRAIWEVTGVLKFACKEPNDIPPVPPVGDCDCEIRGAFNVPGAGQPNMQFTPAVCEGCELEESSFQYRDPEEGVELDVSRVGPGEVTDVDCDFDPATGIAQATFVGQAPATICGEEFEDCTFEITVTDVPPNEGPETAQVTIVCDERTYDSGLLEGAGRGIMIRDCPLDQ